MTQILARVAVGGLAVFAILACGQSGYAQTVEKPKVSIGAAGSSGQIAFLALNVLKTKGYFKGIRRRFRHYGFRLWCQGRRGAGDRDSRYARRCLRACHPHAGEGAGHQVCGLHIQCARPLVLGVTKAFAPNFKSIADLKGKYVGVSAPGSATHNFLNLLLTRAGLKPEDVSVISVGNAMGAIAAIRTRGELQAIVNYDPVIAELEWTG